MAKGVMLVAEDRKSEIKQHKMAWASLAPLGIHQDQLQGGMVQFMMEFEKGKILNPSAFTALL